MIIHDEMELNQGLLFSDRELIGIADGGTVDYEYFIPDRFVYEFLHDSDKNDNKPITSTVET